jgi:hypothetical protein
MRKKKGRPRLKWKDDVELDLRNMGVKRWTRILEGTEWESLVRDANIRFKGLLCQRRRCTVQINIKKNRIAVEI